MSVYLDSRISSIQVTIISGAKKVNNCEELFFTSYYIIVTCELRGRYGQRYGPGNKNPYKAASPKLFIYFANKVAYFFSQMSTENTQKKLLEKIINSAEFSGSKVYASYLAYLVEAAKSGKCLKETSIAIDFFGKDANFNPAEDTIVRSHTYTLRKKLQSYYYSEGKDDEYRLRIPKGHYETTFVPITENLYHPKHLFRWLSKRYYLLIILILCILLGLMWIYYQNLCGKLETYQIIDRNDPIWQEYLQSKLPVLVVVGDHFFFNKYDETYQYAIDIRHGKINSLADMEALKKEFPDNSIKSTEEPYFPYHSIWSLPPVLSILYSAGQKPLMRKSSSISPQILGEFNLIFLGSIKTLYTLKHTLSESHFAFEILPHKITYTAPDSSESQVFRTSLHSAGPNEDLVLALKLPGPANNSIFIIASYHSLGAPEIVNYLTATATRKGVEQKFIDKYGKMPQYFEILFRVTGIDKTAYNTEMLIYNEITKN